MAKTIFTKSIPQRNKSAIRMRVKRYGLKPYTQLRHLLVDKPVFILGSGTSLFFEKKLRVIFDYPVIAVNSSVLLTQWRDDGDKKNRFWLSNDALCRKWSYWPLVLRSNLNGIIRDSWGRYFKEVQDFYVFSGRGDWRNKFDVEENKLIGCSSVPSSLDMAIQLGCKLIFLLGVDHYFQKGKRYFWEYWEKDKRPVYKKPHMHPERHQKRIFKQNNEAYGVLKKVAHTLNIGVFNCNLKSHVNIFDKIDIEDALNYIKIS
ncbi:MAG: hypothetical protein ACOC5T_04480 [Elusimicrobiota bacterium]